MPKTRYHALDGLRGVCALLVLGYHAFEKALPGRVFAHGYLSVDLFFVISGFVIAASYEPRFAAGLGLRGFVAARLKRLAPVYWMGALLGLASSAIVLATGTSAYGGTAMLALGVAGLLLIPMIGSSGEAFPQNPPSWTLFTELMVNIVYGALARSLSNRILVLILLLCWAGMEMSALSTGHGFYYGWRGTEIFAALYRGGAGFAAGVLIWRGTNGGWLRLPAVTPLLPVALWTAVCLVPAPGPTLLFDSVAVMLVAPLSVALLVAGKARSPAWFDKVGALSYPLYASHFAVVGLARHFSNFTGKEGMSPFVLGGATILAAIALGWAVRRAEPVAARLMAGWLRAPDLVFRAE